MKALAIAAGMFALSSLGFAEPPRGHYCNLGVFTPAGLQRHRDLVPQLAGAITERRELPNGYAFKFSGKFEAAGEWLDGTRRCCPTLDYQIEFTRQAGTAWLRVTGGAGAKEFIREEFRALMETKASRDWTLEVDSENAVAKLDTALAAARSAHKPVLVDVYADWCAACRLLDQGALSDREVVRELGEFVTVRIDVSTSSPLSDVVADRFGVRALPALCLISPDGKLTRLAGTISATQLTDALRRTVNRRG